MPERLIKKPIDLPPDWDKPGPWVVKNGDSTRFRCLTHGYEIDWTSLPDLALQFYRRQDAEAWAQEDEDAWRIVSLAEKKWWQFWRK